MPHQGEEERSFLIFKGYFQRKKTAQYSDSSEILITVSFLRTVEFNE